MPLRGSEPRLTSDRRSGHSSEVPHAVPGVDRSSIQAERIQSYYMKVIDKNMRKPDMQSAGRGKLTEVTAMFLGIWAYAQKLLQIC